MLDRQSRSRRQLLTTEEAADHLGLSVQTLCNWRAKGASPLPWVKVGRYVRYKLADLEAYIAAHTQGGPAA